MFYHPHTLRRGGRFYLCWVAANWPSQFQRSPPRSLRAYPVAQLSMELQQIIQDETQSVNRRYALRLSSRLVHGLVLIYRKQVQLLLSDLLYLESYVWKHVENLHKPQKKKKVTELYEHEQPIPLEINLEKIDRFSVKNINDITLRDEVIPPTVIPNDGFGDEANKLLLELFVPEVMLKENNPSLVDITAITEEPCPIDTLEKTKMNITDVTMQMNLPDEVNRAIETTEDILKIPEILITSHDNEKMTIENISPKNIIPRRTKRKREVLTDILEKVSLESVSTVPQKKKKKRSLIIDEELILPTSVMIKRINNVNIEQRCSTAIDDAMKYDVMFLPNTASLFKNPAHNRLKPKLAQTFIALFARNAITELKPNDVSILLKEKEMMREKKIDESLKTSFIVENVNDQSTITHHVTLPDISEIPEIVPLSPAGVSKLSVHDKTMLDDLSLGKNLDEIITVEKYLESTTITSPQKKPSKSTSMEPSNKPSKLDDNVKKIGANALIVQADVHAEQNGNIPEDVNVPPIIQTSAEVSGQDSDEVGLGSLDRTLVSIGDESPTGSYKSRQNFLDENWEPTGLFKEILIAKRDGIRPINLEMIVNKAYRESQPVSRRMIAARAFSSLLRLKKHGIVNIKKKPGTCEIFHIKVGSRAKEMMQ